MAKSGKKSDLTDRQRRAIGALLSEPTIRAAAEAVGGSEATLYRWIGEECFSSALKDARSRALESMLSALQGASGKAVETLCQVMADKMASDAARVSAARTILGMTLHARDLLEVEDRLRALEAQLLRGGRP